MLCFPSHSYNGASLRRHLLCRRCVDVALFGRQRLGRATDDLQKPHACGRALLQSGDDLGYAMTISHAHRLIQQAQTCPRRRADAGAAAVCRGVAVLYSSKIFGGEVAFRVLVDGRFAVKQGAVDVSQRVMRLVFTKRRNENIIKVKVPSFFVEPHGEMETERSKVDVPWHDATRLGAAVGLSGGNTFAFCHRACCCFLRRCLPRGFQRVQHR
mgnify:CR=1 FL=1